VNARRVHAVLAAGVENPTLIARWRAEPARLGRLGVDPACFDLDALWKFAGLTIKVRHNGVRQQLPGTFRLMALAGLEIGLFADYAAFRQATGQRYAAATPQRTHDLVAFITDWIDPSVPVHALLGDIVRHEHALVCLNAAPAREIENPPGPEEAPVAARQASAVPALRGRIELHEMHCDPLVLAAALRQAIPPLADIPLQTRYYGYWRGDPHSAIAVLELDAFGYYLLSLVDGCRSIADLSQALGGRRRPTRRFTRSLAQLEDLGLLTFARGQAVGAA
jgi:hypothetical protein